jgi:hypothetical protein
MTCAIACVIIFLTQSAHRFPATTSEATAGTSCVIREPERRACRRRVRSGTGWVASATVPGSSSASQNPGIRSSANACRDSTPGRSHPRCGRTCASAPGGVDHVPGAVDPGSRLAVRPLATAARTGTGSRPSGLHHASSHVIHITTTAGRSMPRPPGRSRRITRRARHARCDVVQHALLPYSSCASDASRFDKSPRLPYPPRAPHVADPERRARKGGKP